jgi:hypothetical protein
VRLGDNCTIHVVQWIDVEVAGLAVEAAIGKGKQGHAER